MSFPIFESPMQTIALAVLIFAGASLITALVGRRKPSKWLIVALVAAVGGMWMTRGMI